MKLLSLLSYKNVMQFKLFFPVYETWPLGEKFRVNKRMSYLFYFYLYKTRRNRIIHEILYERIDDTLWLRRWLEFRTLKLFSQIWIHTVYVAEKVSYEIFPLEDGHTTETCSGYSIKYSKQCCIRRKPWTWPNNWKPGRQIRVSLIYRTLEVTSI
jgi:hypothetical protein